MKLFKGKTKLPTITCDICLVIYNKILLHAEHKNLVAQPDESLYSLMATEIAQAARRLLPNTDKRHRLALALPNFEFVATTVQLPIMAEQNLKSAVMLQIQTLLPGVTGPLLLTIQSEGGKPTSALWLPAKRAEELYQAFNKVGLYLTCILPRALLNIPRGTASCQVYDEDEDSITCFEWSGTNINRWLHIAKTDYDHPEFKTQWEQSLTSLNNEIKQEGKTNLQDWERLTMPTPVVYKYAFLPPGTVLHLAQVAKRRHRRRLQMAAVFLLLCTIGAIGAVINYEQRLQKRLENLTTRTVDARKLKEEVAQIEETIGPIKDFPQQQVTSILQTLNRAIPKNSWITSVRIEAGTVKIEGYSPNPAELIGILLAQPGFIDVAPSQATQSERGRSENRFGINFKLKDINFKDYWVQYFPIQ